MAFLQVTQHVIDYLEPFQVSRFWATLVAGERHNCNKRKKATGVEF